MFEKVADFRGDLDMNSIEIHLLDFTIQISLNGWDCLRFSQDCDHPQDHQWKKSH